MIRRRGLRFFSFFRAYMKLHRFIVDFPLEHNTFLLHDSELVFQIVHVLKLRAGERFLLGDGKGKEVIVKISDITDKGLALETEQWSENANEPHTKVTMFAAILKADHFELLAQKCTEAGVFQIIPIVTKRTVKLNLRHDRIQKIIQEAAEQSGRAMVPALGAPLSFEEALKMIPTFEKSFFLDFDAPMHLKDKETNLKNVSLFIGPEGGFDPTEMKLAQKAGCVIAHLGPLTLRAETAAIVSTFILAS